MTAPIPPRRHRTHNGNRNTRFPMLTTTATKAPKATSLAVLAALAGLLAGCGEVAPPEAERIRAIKPYYVVEPSGGDVRRYSGTVAAATTSALSFAVSGTVQTVGVNQGDHVTQGQVLATLDTEPFELDVQAASSELSAARADFENKRVELDRQRQLFERGWVAKAAYDQAVAAFEAAEGQLNLARSRLGLAERDLSQTSLTAPFDGLIAVRDVDPFVEVTKGQTIFQIDSADALEVDLAIPDGLVTRLSVGTPVTVDAATIPGCGCTGRITEIGVQAGAANAVLVKAAILDVPDGLLPGMAVEAGIVLSDTNGTRGYMAPIVAIAAGDDVVHGYVFKYDPDTSVVRKVPVSSDEIVSGNLISITNGIAAGDIIAAAGVSFLRDGQRVTLLGDRRGD